MDKKFVTKFVGYWVVNVFVLALFNTFFPESFELGNINLSITMAVLFSAFLVTTLLFLAKGVSRTQGFMIKGKLMLFVYYWASASVAVWLVARIATVSGFGIVNFLWALIAGFAISLSNWSMRQVFKGMKML